MLKQILRAIHKGDFNQVDAAQELNISQDSLKMALQQLMTMGYLKDDQLSSGCCSVDCGTCSSVSNCNKLTVYMLTEKGRKYIK